jgi:pimeloyl-ACP methyl ester carboxylesterase
MSTNIVVLLPGTSGSTLIKPNGIVPVWPEQVAITAVLGKNGPANAAALLEGTQLIPGQILTTNPKTRQPTSYATFINSFHGYQQLNVVWPQQSQPPAPAVGAWSLPRTLQPNVLVGFAYDWRQDNTTTAKWLQSLLGTLYLTSGQNCTITLVGHSMGGLVARAYLEVIGSGDPWFGSIRRLITLGTPHFGAPLALDAIVDDVSAVFAAIGAPDAPKMDIVIWKFVNSNFDSTYELLPPPGNSFVNDGGTSKSIFPFSGLSSGLQSSLRSEDFSTSNAAAATTFFSTLSYSGSPSYFCIYGTGSNTVTSFSFSNGSLTSTNGDGDEVVPSSSASFAGKLPAGNTVAVPGATHLGMPGDPQVINQVHQWIGS